MKPTYRIILGINEDDKKQLEILREKKVKIIEVFRAGLKTLSK